MRGFSLLALVPVALAIIIGCSANTPVVTVAAPGVDGGSSTKDLTSSQDGSSKSDNERVCGSENACAPESECMQNDDCGSSNLSCINSGCVFTPPQRVPSRLAQITGGGITASPSYVLRASIGGSAPLGVTKGTGFQLEIGPLR